MSTTKTYQVAASGNDGGYNPSNGLILGSTVVTLGFSTVAYDGIFLFTGVDVPQGATVNSAKMQFHAPQTRTTTTTSVIISANDADSPVYPTSASDYTGRTITDAVVGWTIPGWTTGSWYDSPDISTIIQEILNRTGWSSGNSILLFVKDNGSTYRRVADAYEGSTSFCAKLVIEYTESAGGTPVTVTAATASASAEALAATPHADVLVHGSTATASAEALPATPTTALIVLGAVASAVAEALPATPHADVVVQASVAEATAEALPATAVYNVHVTVLAATATASAEALPAEPIAQRNITVEAATGTATAEALAAVARSGKKLYYIIRYR